MFKCNFCKHDIGPGVAEIKVVREKRERKYPASADHREGLGWEIAKEVRACAPCAAANSAPVLDPTNPRVSVEDAVKQHMEIGRALNDVVMEEVRKRKAADA